ncbi:MAG: tetratricopeptide repeat protein [Bacillota bacterium]
MKRIGVILLIPVILGAGYYLIIRRHSGGITRYTLPGGAKTARDSFFSFSPLDGRKVWIGRRDQAWELDPSSGKWTNLKPILGFAGGKMTGASGFQRDPVDRNLLWGHAGNRYIILYDIRAKKTGIYDFRAMTGNAVYGVLCRRKVVWFHTSRGLLFYDRFSKTIGNVKEFTDVEVGRIDADGERVWINGEYNYDPGNGRIGQVYALPGWPVAKVGSFALRNGYKFFSGQAPRGGLVIMDPGDRIIAAIPGAFDIIDRDGRNIYFISSDEVLKFDFFAHRAVSVYKGKLHGRQIAGKLLLFHDYNWMWELDTSTGRMKRHDYYSYRYNFTGPGVICTHGNNVYYHHDGYLRRKDKKTGSVKVFPAVKAGNFIYGGGYFWAMTRRDAIRMGKGYVDKNLVAGESIKDRELEFMLNAINSLYSEKDLPARVKKIAELYELALKSRGLLKKYNLPEHAGGYLRINDPGEAKALENLAAATDSPAVKEICCSVLARLPVSLGQPEKALFYYNTLAAEFPSGIFFAAFLPEDVKRLENVCAKLGELNKETGITGDEKLWRLGRIYSEYCEVSWNREENYFDYGCAHGFFKELVEKFPQSRWADNAEYRIFEDYEGLAHEGGDFTSFNCINEYKRLLKKYPSGDIAPVIKLHLAEHYLRYAETAEGNPRVNRHLEEARGYCREILQDRSSEIYRKEALDLSGKIGEYLAKHCWLLRMELKSWYRARERIAVTLVLQNTGEQGKIVFLDDEYPNFIVSLQRGGKEDVQFIKAFLDGGKIPGGVRALNPGETYTEKCDLRRMVLTGNGYGRFKLLPGEYRIRALWVSEDGIRVRSEEEKLVVK